MTIGRLYRFDDEQFVADVNYQLYDKSSANLWGELTLSEYRWLDDGAGYVIELTDDCKRQCHLKRRVNRAVNGVPPRYVYHFTVLP